MSAEIAKLPLMEKGSCELPYDITLGNVPLALAMTYRWGYWTVCWKKNESGKEATTIKHPSAAMCLTWTYVSNSVFFGAHRFALVDLLATSTK